MIKHLKYFRYILIHKYWVFRYACKLGIPFRGIFHDISKLLPSEWFPYVEAFYGQWGYKFKKDYDILKDTPIAKYHERIMSDFDLAWLKHQYRNSHHWQHWILREDSGNTKLLRIPETIMKEMLADWLGAGKSISGIEDIKEWWPKNKDKIQINAIDKDRMNDWIHCEIWKH